MHEKNKKIVKQTKNSDIGLTVGGQSGECTSQRGCGQAGGRAVAFTTLGTHLEIGTG